MATKTAEPSCSPWAYVKRWFNLGIDTNQPDWRIQMQGAEQQFARDNLRIMPSICLGACIIMGMIMLSRGLVHGWDALNWVPFAIGILIAIACAIQALHAREQAVPWMSVALVDLLSTCWYILAIYANVVLQPDKASVIMCLVFMAIPLLFDSLPRRSISMSVVAFAAMLFAEAVLAPTGIRHTDVNNTIVAVFVGLGCSHMKSATKVQSLRYLNMFRAATKTTRVVAQIDLERDTFVALQIPPSLAFLLRGETSAARFIAHVADTFIAPEWTEKFTAFLDVSTLSERMSPGKQLTFEYQSVDQMWNQLTIVEERSVQGCVKTVIMVVRDIDAAKRQELAYQQQLREAVDEAQRANASKSNFLRRMSHDVRTPINGIRGITKIAERFPTDIAKQAECRRKTLEASDYLLMLVNNVLDMSKLESGNIELERKAFRMSDILAEVSTLAGMQASEHGITFLRDSEGERIEHDRLVGSPVHLRQVLHNLTSNAVKYNKEGGSVVLRCVELAGGNGQARFRITVEDTGIGMSEEFLAHAFDPFTQEEQEQSRTTYAGTGLGLSIVKEFSEHMGGTVEVSSALGVGSQFTLTIPFAIDDSVPVEEAESASKHSFAGKRALVAEDNELNREIAEFVLTELGLEVTLAPNGKAALEAFADSQPGTFDVVFMDIMMPVLDGLEAARAIRQLDRPDAGSIPILAMTANAFQDDIKRSQEAGMNAHLTKPLEIDKIDDALSRWL